MRGKGALYLTRARVRFDAAALTLHLGLPGGAAGAMDVPRVFCASKIPSFLAGWRVRGPAGTGSVGRGVGEGEVREGGGCMCLQGEGTSGAPSFEAARWRV